MNNVLQLRTAMAMTQDEFAERCNVSRISIARYEAGAEINRSNALKIATACGVSVEYVLGVSQANAQPDEATIFRERIRRDPEYRMLFSAANKAKPEQLKAAAAMLKALEPNDDN